jgi:hypothetical protein
VPRPSRAERLREWLQEAAAAVGFLLLGAVFVGGIVWSASRQEERGPIAAVVAGVLLVVVVVLAVGLALIGACLLFAIAQMGGGFEPNLFFQFVVLLFLGACVAGLLALAWLLLLVV